MSWVKLDDRVWSHRKFAKLSGEAARLWMFALCWANAHGTDGMVPEECLPMLRGTSKQARELVATGLWHDHEGGWKIHDYLDYQPGSSRDAQAKEANRERVQRHRSKRNVDVMHYDVTPVMACNSPPSRPVPSRPDQVTSNLIEGNPLPVAKPEKPKAPRPKAERFVPETWQPNDAHQAKATELGVLLRREVDSFRSHEFKVPKTDWDRAFHGWLTRSAQFGTSSGPGRPVNRFPPKMGEPGWRRQPDAGVVNEADYGWPPDEVANG